MSTLATIITYVGAFILGTGLALGCLIAMNRREIKRRADEQRRMRLPVIEHYDP